MKNYAIFVRAFSHYKLSWENWILSDYCFLNAEEIKIVQMLNNAASVQTIAIMNNRSIQTTRGKIRRIIRKLQSGKIVFDEWREKYKDGTDQNNYPLYVPVTCLPISTRLKTSIYPLGSTLHEVLSATQGNLKQYRRFGKGNQEELEYFLSSRMRLKNHQPVNTCKKNSSLIACRVRE